jgi:hypothetical protein
MARLDILVHGGCLSEHTARRLAEEIRHELPHWDITVKSCSTGRSGPLRSHRLSRLLAGRTRPRHRGPEEGLAGGTVAHLGTGEAMSDRASVLQTRTVRAAHPLAERDEPSPVDSDITRPIAVQTVFQDIAKTFEISFVPELFEDMRHRPSYLNTAWTLFKDEMNLECLDRRTKRVIALAVSTNEAGNFFIAAMPDAFCRSALDPATGEKLLSTIRFFKAFDRYLSGIMPAVASDAVTVVNNYLREEYLSDPKRREPATLRALRSTAHREDGRRDPGQDHRDHPALVCDGHLLVHPMNARHTRTPSPQRSPATRFIERPMSPRPAPGRCSWQSAPS